MPGSASTLAAAACRTLGRSVAVVIPVAGLVFVLGCSNDPDADEAGGGPGASSPASGISESERASAFDAEYRGIFDEPVQLEKGRYQGPPYVPDGASRPELVLIADRMAAGDLDGDGRKEIATVLARSEGGSGTFLYLALLREAGEGLVNFETLLLGDRVQVSTLEIHDRTLVTGLLTHGPSDPACCPTLAIWRTWELLEDRLREVRVLRGDLVYGHESREFTPCGEEESYWVQDGTEGDLPQVYQALAARPYEPLFAEVLALIIPESGPGFAAEYDAQIRVTKLFRAAREGPGCRQDLKRVDFRALGVEPFWTLDVTREALEFRVLGAEPRLFEIETTSESAAVLGLSGQAQDGGSLKVEIRDQRCTDPMSGAVYPLQAAVTVDGTTYGGCAMRGDPG